MKGNFGIHHVEITTCPKCEATCKVGNDDDGQVFCAACRSTFKPQVTTEVLVEEYADMYQNATEKHMVSGWEAFID